MIRFTDHPTPFVRRLTGNGVFLRVLEQTRQAIDGGEEVADLGGAAAHTDLTLKPLDACNDLWRRRRGRRDQVGCEVALQRLKKGFAVGAPQPGAGVPARTGEIGAVVAFDDVLEDARGEPRVEERIQISAASSQQ